VPLRPRIGARRFGPPERALPEDYGELEQADEIVGVEQNSGGSDEDGQYRVPIRRRRCARGRTRSSLHT
jgi:hypothetical protein